MEKISNSILASVLISSLASLYSLNGLNVKMDNTTKALEKLEAKFEKSDEILEKRGIWMGRTDLRIERIEEEIGRR